MTDFQHAKEQLRSIDPDKFAEISGGSCTLSDFTEALNNIEASYEKLIDFTSYVIERVAGN